MLTVDDTEHALELSVALGHVAALIELAKINSAARMMKQPDRIRSASDRHLVDYGHRLHFGCCRDPGDTPAHVMLISEQRR